MPSHDDFPFVDEAEDGSDTRDCDRLRRARLFALEDLPSAPSVVVVAGAATLACAYLQSLPWWQFPAFQYRHTMGLLGARDWDLDLARSWNVLYNAL